MQSKEPYPCQKGQLAILALELASTSPVAHRGCHQSFLHIGRVILRCMVKSLPYHINYKGEPGGVVSNSGTPPQIPKVNHDFPMFVLPHPRCRCMLLRKMWDFGEKSTEIHRWLLPAELSVRRIHKVSPVDLCQHIVWERCLELNFTVHGYAGGWMNLDQGKNIDRKSGNQLSFFQSRIPASSIQF